MNWKYYSFKKGMKIKQILKNYNMLLITIKLLLVKITFLYDDKCRKNKIILILIIKFSSH